MSLTHPSLVPITIDHGSVEDAVVAASTNGRPAALERRSRAPRLVLLVGALLTGLVVAVMAADLARASIWEAAHWDISATTAVLAIALRVRSSTGQARQVTIGSLVAMLLWLLSHIAWTALALTGTVTFPTVADVLALLWVVPGGWMLITSLRGHLRPAEEIAVYLDVAMAFLATAAVLLAVFGPTAYFIGGASGLLVALYPAIFLGAAVASLVAVFAIRQPLRAEGAIAFAVGSALIGIAFSAWVIPAVTGGPSDHASATLFSIGPLVVAYGAITWQGPTVLSGPQERLAAIVGWTIGPVAVLVTAISAAVMAPIDQLRHVAFWLTVVAATLLIARFAMHLKERTATLAEMRRLLAENEDLVARLRREALERERVHARLIDASRMSAVGELAAAVAHEINNPLTGVLGYSDLLLADPDLKPDVRQDLEIVRTEAMRVRDRVRVLLDFATPRRPDAVDADLAQVVAAPMALLRYHLERRGLQVEERYADLPLMPLDAPAIQQVVINLVTEVSAAMPAGGRLVIATEASWRGSSLVLDATGTGIDVGAIRSAERPFDDDADQNDQLGAIASSYGVLRGHDATIGIRVATEEHVRIEIHLPRRKSTPD
ncbi:MAG: histidine kinase dimerization/phospho-acceptor domain-containing protein [Candidatus Limnocylindrales bacterium]